MNANYNKEFIDNIYEFLNCNQNGVIFDENNLKEREIETELNRYHDATISEVNYASLVRQGGGAVESLEAWRSSDNGSEYPYPNIHPIQRKLVDSIKGANVTSVCELGAGAGEVSKYVYDVHENLNLCCVENHSGHFSQMLENFETRTDVLPPDIKVNAKTIKNSIHNLNEVLEDDSYELVFTCTVMMHLPFLIACAVACEAARVSSKYIYHAESINNTKNTITEGDAGLRLSHVNFLQLDYRKIYDKLGFECVSYEESPYPGANCDCAYYLGKKR